MSEPLRWLLTCLVGLCFCILLAAVEGHSDSDWPKPLQAMLGLAFLGCVLGVMASAIVMIWR